MKRWSRLLIGVLIALSMAALSLAVRAVLSGRDEPQVRARLVVVAEETTGFAQAEAKVTGTTALLRRCTPNSWPVPVSFLEVLVGVSTSGPSSAIMGPQRKVPWGRPVRNERFPPRPSRSTTANLSELTCTGSP
jgi:hypothetical protein